MFNCLVFDRCAMLSVTTTCTLLIAVMVTDYRRPVYCLSVIKEGRPLKLTDDIHVLQLSSSKSLSQLLSAPRRNLGCAVIAAAIGDYMSCEEDVHQSASRFLYPASDDYRERYSWAVSLATGVDPAWLREALDRAKPTWDQQRFLLQVRIRQERSERGAAAKDYQVEAMAQRDNGL